MKKIFALAALAFAASTACAADNSWYVGGDIGSSRFKIEGDSGSKTGFGASVGYQLNTNVAFEASVRRLGSDTEDGLKLSVNALQISALGIAPLNKEFSLFARLGVSRNSLDFTVSNIDLSLHKTKAFFGLGGAYQFDKALSLRAEYVNLGNNKISAGGESAEFKIHQFNLGLNYAF
ncbi:porin family protein [Paucibacter sp. DJ2R-2]|uniref:porin family protein n=1 Tax=Paucibacter sp. DJ2R-2 TaxID=2893558 RepID=UPI0021E40036|nr:porin family protein [Paucibacter sp. DJ2R-2]MCV2422495.1 porin family protein [Paucibacter sp. DJ4R-1]MCV2440353.1 porin family protein [Paucibacter sp. DJ2R-2]